MIQSFFSKIKAFPNHVHVGKDVHPHENFDIFEIMELIEKGI
jgi:hypothetical protein